MYNRGVTTINRNIERFNRTISQVSITTQPVLVIICAMSTFKPYFILCS